MRECLVRLQWLILLASEHSLKQEHSSKPKYSDETKWNVESEKQEDGNNDCERNFDS